MPKYVEMWLPFAAGFAVGALILWLWMRTRVTELQLRREAAEQATGKMGETFQLLADSALRSNQTTFLQAAGSKLDPLNETIVRLEKQVRELERERQRMFGSLGEQLQHLAKETGALGTALRSPQARGRWGEITLRRVAELAGMVQNCDFHEQRTHDGETGTLRPDMVVHLPGSRSLVVDAKVPLTAYLDATAASEEAPRKAAFFRHAQQVREHVRQLSSKQYWTQFQPAPELVVLFLPGDHFFSAALEQAPDLIEEALARRVLIATPVTLISVLKGISYGWNQERLAENAERIRSVAGEFQERIQTVHQYYAETGRQLEKTVECYNRSVGSWDSRLLPSLRKLRDLGIGPGQEPDEADIVDVATRRPRAVGARAVGD